MSKARTTKRSGPLKKPGAKKQTPNTISKEIEKTTTPSKKRVVLER